MCVCVFHFSIFNTVMVIYSWAQRTQCLIISRNVSKTEPTRTDNDTLAVGGMRCQREGSPPHWSSLSSSASLTMETNNNDDGCNDDDDERMAAEVKGEKNEPRWSVEPHHHHQRGSHHYSLVLLNSALGPDGCPTTRLKSVFVC